MVSSKSRFVVFPSLKTWKLSPIEAVNPLGNMGALASPESTSLSGTGRADRLIGTSRSDVLSGLGGNDLLDGRKGRDRMTGGTGNDTYIVDNTGDRVIEKAKGGTDTVKASVSWTLGSQAENLILTGRSNLKGTGNSLANTLIGNTGHNTLDGKSGADRLAGGKGNDTYVVDNTGDRVTERTGEGTDTVRASVSHTLGSGVENLVLLGRALNGKGNTLANRITGNSLSNLLDGASGNDVLDGGSGDDTLVGGSGVDTLRGGAGNDTYDVDSMSDVVAESADGGADTVLASVSYTLGAHVERLVLAGGALAGTGNALDNIIIGTAGNNTLDGADGNDTLDGADGNDTLDGGEGNDTLDGGTGADTLVGGSGNDVYEIDHAGDVIDDQGDGTDFDTVRTTLHVYSLGIGLEALVMLDASAGNIATGNILNNVITTGSSDDFLDGLSGADTLRGGAGNDTYTIDRAQDVVIELAGEGTDTVRSFTAAYTLGDHLENLLLLGVAARGTGNGLDNRLTGNGGANTLEGLDGNDTLEGAGGQDNLRGGIGNDLYIVDGTDTVTEAAGEGTDTVEAVASFTLSENVEILVLTGSANINGTGNGTDNRIVGNGGDNILDGAGGTDTLEGGAGNDIYVLENPGETVVDTSGIDTVRASYDFGTYNWQTGAYGRTTYLQEGIERLELTGNAVVGIGRQSTGDDYILGNGGNNVLEGIYGTSFGGDTLNGGAGNDILFGSQTGRTFFEFDGRLGEDTIHNFNAAEGDRIDLRRLYIEEVQAASYAIAQVRHPEGFDTLEISVFVNSKTGGTWNGKITLLHDSFASKPNDADWILLM
jgi:Ca2+-binding RTX toxin-like protein